MQKKFLRDVIVLVAGKSAEGLAEFLDGKKYVNEFILAKKLDITINQVRNILYKVADQGLVSSTRKKDKKKGWYTYFWKIEVVKALEFLQELLIKKMDQIKNQIKSREVKDFYICERCGIEFNEENALLNDFTCNECGDIFVIKDNSRLLKELRKVLMRLEKESGMVEKEIVLEKEMEEKKKMRIIKKLEKERKEKLAEKRKISAAKRKLTMMKKVKGNKRVTRKKSSKKKNNASKKKKPFVKKRVLTGKTSKKKEKKKIKKKIFKKKKEKGPVKRLVKKSSRKKVMIKPPKIKK